jgi:hypothetical protein
MAGKHVIPVLKELGYVKSFASPQPSPEGEGAPRTRPADSNMLNDEERVNGVDRKQDSL